MRDAVVLLRYYSYLYIMKTILILNFILAYTVLFSAIIIGVSLMVLKHFPTSKVSDFVRRHIITDVDIDPIKVEPLEKGLLEDDILEPPLKNQE